MKDVFKEIINMVVTFFRPFGLKDKMLLIPKDVKKMGFKVELLRFIMMIISLIFAFMLKIINISIENRLIFLGIILFMLYRGEQIVRDAFVIYQDSEQNKFDMIYEDEMVLRASTIISKTTDRVLKYDERNNLYSVLSNESMLNTIKSYLSTLWKLKMRYIFNVFEILSIILMIIIAILTNDSVSQPLFISLIIVFSFISFISTSYINVKRVDFYNNNRKYNNMQSLIVNDLLRVPAIVKKDLDMRINKFKKSVIDSNKNVSDFHKKRKKSNLIVTILETSSQYGIIILYLLKVDWNEISLSTITQITAILVIVETILNKIERLSYTFESFNNDIVTIKNEEEDMKLILDTYYEEEIKSKDNNQISKIMIKPFSIRYLEESENDKPFTLTSLDNIEINYGDVAVLYGPSGSGKSTFMKLLTERIRVEKSIDIPSTRRFMFYDEKLKFGSLSVYEELFCDSNNCDLNKMKEILTKLYLWDELESNCVDVWQWMKEKRFDLFLSNGQKQRLILAKMLYWLDDTIDVLVLDECTSGLDDEINENSADAQKILEYIVRYANNDKKRIIIISTHQNIDVFKENLLQEYNFKNLYFMKENNLNIIKEK